MWLDFLLMKFLVRAVLKERKTQVSFIYLAQSGCPNYHFSLLSGNQKQEVSVTSAWYNQVALVQQQAGPTPPPHVNGFDLAEEVPS